MRPNLKLDATKVYLFIEFTGSAFFSMMFVTMSLYEATVAGLTAVQLVLVGTILEISAFVFEIPTGVVADAYSRRLSIIIGYVLMGIGFFVEGFFPAFLPILFAQVIWGLGYTFTSGATQAWISDEIGEEPANRLFLRATRTGLFASLIGMGGAMLIGVNNVALPIQIGAIGVASIGVVLIFIMPETGFHPIPKEDRNNWQHMSYTFREGVKSVRASPRLMNILGVGFVYGLYSEGFDRLWVKHLLDHFDVPILFGNNQIAFFAVLRITGSILTILVLRFVEKRFDSGGSPAIGRAMLLITGMISAAMIGFAVSRFLPITLILYLIVNVLREIWDPINSGWVNQKLDPQTRATVHSITGQVDAIGQMGGGPLAALIAGLYSVPSAIAGSGSLLMFAFPLIVRANRQPPAMAEDQCGTGIISE
jgi:DHA3 family tetracycline resistance protein-like MFS transporter